MKKSFIICMLASIMGLSVVGCSNKSKEDKIKEFAVAFADKAANNQIDSLKIVYPGIENADSVALKYVAEGIVVNPSEEVNQYEVILSPEVTIWINEDEDCTYTVTKSKGLFAYPKDKMDFATKTGLWNDSLNDTDFAQRMNDEEFKEYINEVKYIDKNNILLVNTKLTSNNSSSWGESGYYTIKNNTDKTVIASDYKMEYKDEMVMPFSEPTFKRYSEQGQEIPPHGVIKIKGGWSHAGSGHYEEDHHLIGTTILLSQQELQDRFATYTGNEYQEYLDSKTKESK